MLLLVLQVPGLLVIVRLIPPCHSRSHSRRQMQLLLLALVNVLHNKLQTLQ